jgi:hypothetical protein
MDMRMKAQIACPGMQDCGDVKLRVFAEPLWVGGQGQERVRCRSDQESKNRDPVVVGEAVQFGNGG